MEGTLQIHFVDPATGPAGADSVTVINEPWDEELAYPENAPRLLEIIMHSARGLPHRFKFSHITSPHGLPVMDQKILGLMLLGLAADAAQSARINNRATGQKG